ncbi:MAG: ABC transporter permease [Lachnospiraceae bacterium]|nr:ABC transporter permease [Lachnospiraceae bacterium]
MKRFCQDMKKYTAYAIRMAKADLGAEVANAYLDWLWWMIEPVCNMLMYTLIFGVVFRASEPFFPIFIFIGISMWGFFSRSISGSVNTVRVNKGIITKIYMPKYILLFSKMLVNGFKMLVSFGVVAVMMIVFRVTPTPYILYAIPILIVLFLFSFGVGTIMMHYGVYVSDLSYITGIVLSMMVFMTGTFYSLSKRFPQPFGELMEQYNPVAFLIASMRKALLYGQAPAWELLLFWGFISLGLIALGAFTIYSNENAYVKVI